MVSKILKFFNRDTKNLHQAAVLLGVFSLTSQLIGLLRDRLLAGIVGPSGALDVYYASFRIPDFIYNSFASLFSMTVLIPLLTVYLKKDKDNKEELTRFADNIFSVYIYGMLVVCGIFFVLMPFLSHLISPGFNTEQTDLLVMTSRLMLVSPFLMGLSSLLGSFSQVQKKFFAFAIAPVFYNAGILFGIIVLRPIWGIKGMVIGVILGAVLHVASQFPTLIELKFFPKIIKKIDFVLIKKVVLLSLPRTIGLSLTSFSVLIITSIASMFATGSVSIFQLSYNIQTTPMMIIGISYSVAAFPTLSKLFLEEKKEEFKNLIYRTTRTILFLSLPIGFIFIVLRAYIIRILLGAGNFSWNDTRLSAACLALFSISIAAQSIILLLVRAFYAMENTKIPLKINTIAVFLTPLFVFIFITIFKIPFARDFIISLLRLDGVKGIEVIFLALSFSLAQIWNAALLWIIFHKKMPFSKESINGLARASYQIVGASILAAAGSYATVYIIGTGINQTHLMGILIQGFSAGFVGLGVYAGVLYLLKNEDIVLFWDSIVSKFWKQQPVITQQADL